MIPTFFVVCSQCPRCVCSCPNSSEEHIAPAISISNRLLVALAREDLDPLRPHLEAVLLPHAVFDATGVRLRSVPFTPRKSRPRCKGGDRCGSGFSPRC
jgi:hypothetical protein